MLTRLTANWRGLSHGGCGLLQDPLVQGWLEGVEPAWTLLTFESLLALRHEPSAVQSAIQIANDLSVDEIAGSAVARNTLILLKHAIERVGLPLTATGNLSRATVAEMCKLIEWPNYDQANAFRRKRPRRLSLIRNTLPTPEPVRAAAIAVSS